ncbi:MAG TPA: FAD-dependent oxidoreductase [Desulfohalobiaceae bacterium]|nr:FAD-dependent oxidoreductase [Desulfohalobiaceae bacterium]
MRFVVVGGDAAGMSAASRAKRKDPDIDITVLEQSHDVSYSACGMPYNIADPEREIEDLVVRPAHVFQKKIGLDLRLGYRVERLDRNAQNVQGTTSQGESFSLDYEKLLFANGASPVVPEISGIDAPGVKVLKSLGHGREIKEYLKTFKINKAVILGMGYIALEMAEALRARDIEVQMIKPRQRFLPWLNEQLASVVWQELLEKQVGLFPGHEVKAIEKSDSGYEILCKDNKFQADFVLVAVGVEPNSQIAAEAGLDLGPCRSISVDKGMRTSDADIFAAGDCADAYHVVSGHKTWLPLALRANRAGWAVADNVTGSEVLLPGIAGTAVFKVFELEVAKTGLNMEEAAEVGFQPQSVVIESRSRAHAHPGSTSIQVHMIGDQKTGRLLGVQMVGREGVAHRINAPAVALHKQMTVEEFGQTDLAYAPPFSTVWDPLLTTANQLLKKCDSTQNSLFN